MVKRKQKKDSPKIKNIHTSSSPILSRSSKIVQMLPYQNEYIVISTPPSIEEGRRLQNMALLGGTARSISSRSNPTHANALRSIKMKNFLANWLTGYMSTTDRYTKYRYENKDPNDMTLEELKKYIQDVHSILNISGSSCGDIMTRNDLKEISCASFHDGGFNLRDKVHGKYDASIPFEQQSRYGKWRMAGGTCPPGQVYDDAYTLKPTRCSYESGQQNGVGVVYNRSNCSYPYVKTYINGGTQNSSGCGQWVQNFNQVCGGYEKWEEGKESYFEGITHADIVWYGVTYDRDFDTNLTILNKKRGTPSRPERNWSMDNLTYVGGVGACGFVYSKI